MIAVKYKATEDRPYHVSVGAILMNDLGQIACHHFSDYNGIPNFYILMRESLEDDESPQAALTRGLKEEFAATAEIIAYIGSLRHEAITTRDYTWQKTVLYFLCHLTGLGVRNPDDDEAASRMEWHEPAELQRLMHETPVTHEGELLDESSVIQNAVEYVAVTNQNGAV